MLELDNDCQPTQHAATCRRSDTGSRIYLFICSMIQETNDLTYGFNDFMTQCRHSLLICYITSALNLISVNQPICVITETEDAVHMEAKN